uniref:Uncharacterized protein n=1 Tax=Eutreptiella gymnastica TaxID=73025 RepID=A0A7S1JDM9_9EUGL|mmetsp:Transcript_87506/g.152331  ORF Transcript_87506/g.152331 Transcript_87506/m.152331 type:complete len:611 (+) Transcript_87506:48-1880(+)
MAATDIVIPSMDFSPQDMVTCSVQVNSAPLYKVIQGVLRALQGVNTRMQGLDKQATQLRDDMNKTTLTLEKKIDDTGAMLRHRLEEVQQKLELEISSLRNDRAEAQKKSDAKFAQIQAELDTNRSAIQTEEQQRREEVLRVETETNQRITDENEALRQAIAANHEAHAKILEEATGQLTAHDKLLGDHTLELDGVYKMFDFHKPRVLSITTSDAPLDTRLKYLQSTPIFLGFVDNMKQERKRVDGKLDSVIKRLGNAEQTLSNKADQRELEALRDATDTSALEEAIRAHATQFQQMQLQASFAEKALQVGLERKADKERVETVEELLEVLETRVRETLESVGNQRWEQLMDKVADLDGYMQKVDRRKVGRSEFQRMAKRLRQQVVGDMVYDGAIDMHTSVGDLTASLPRSSSALGSTLGSAPTPGRPGSRVLPGLDPSIDAVADAAFIRYRCLSCNKPAAKLVDEGMRPAPKSFPPTAVMSTNPNSPANIAVRKGHEVPLTVLSTGEARSARRMENYFSWVEGHHLEPPNHAAAYGVSSDDDFSGSERSPARRSTRSQSPRVGSPSKQVRTSLVGSDQRMYAGLQELGSVAQLAKDHTSAVRELSQADQR